MRIPSFIGLSLFAAALASTPAAAAVQNLGGVYVPVGTVVIAEQEFETFANDPAQGFIGIGIVNTISDGGVNETYGFGGLNPPPYLYSEFGGFTFTGQVGNDFFFTGGHLNYYTFADNQRSAILSAPTASAAVDLVNNGALWLSLQPVAFDALGNTLVIHTASGQLANANGSSATAFLDVLLGPNAGVANSAFNTCGFVDVFAAGASCPFGRADFYFSASAQNNNPNSPTYAAFPITGTSNLVGSTRDIPEPLTISLFGAGLIGAGALARRRRNKKN